jgi:hypothetical protein
MKRELVTSSVLRSIGYSTANHILEVEFVEQKEIYQYHNVPDFIYHSLMTASSHGEYFNKHIKNQYTFTKTDS